MIDALTDDQFVGYVMLLGVVSACLLVLWVRHARGVLRRRYTLPREIDLRRCERAGSQAEISRRIRTWSGR